MNAANQRRLTPVLATAVVLFGLVFVTLLSGMGRRVHWGHARAAAPLPEAGNPVNLPRAMPLDQFALVWQKPLFSPDRKPVSRAIDGGSNLGDLNLTGIVLTPRLHMALLHDKNGDRQVRLREGESLPDGSVKLVEVRARSALFDAAGGRTELKLPAGAPIDMPKAGADDSAGIAPGDASMRFGAGRANGDQPGLQGPRRHPGDADAPPGSVIERLRENIRRRRAGNAAPTH
jgi:general secretion pathway protein N